MFESGVVAGDPDGPDDGAGAVAERRDGERDREADAVAAAMDDGGIANDVAAAHSAERFVGAGSRIDRAGGGDRLADHLGGGIAVDTFGGGVPASDRAALIGEDDRIVTRVEHALQLNRDIDRRRAHPVAACYQPGTCDGENRRPQPCAIERRAVELSRAAVAHARPDRNGPAPRSS
jgi:hypothetical protein